jgi:hypothetical protein
LGVGVPLNNSAALTGGGDGEAEAAAAEAVEGGLLAGGGAADELHATRHTVARAIRKRIADDCAGFEAVPANSGGLHRASYCTTAAGRPVWNGANHAETV